MSVHDLKNGCISTFGMLLTQGLETSNISEAGGKSILPPFKVNVA